MELSETKEAKRERLAIEKWERNYERRHHAAPVGLDYWQDRDAFLALRAAKSEDRRIRRERE